MEVFFKNTLYKGTKSSWSSNVENPKLFDELDAFISNNKNEYIICFYSYDLKNNIEDLCSKNKDNMKFPDIHCFVPDEIHINYSFEKEKEVSGKGPVGKFFSEASLKEIMKLTGAKIGDSIFLACSKQTELEKITSLARDKIAKDLNLIDNENFAFCWIIDYPMFERDDTSNKIEFSHNPFSMPQGEIDKINFDNPLDILAYQYDIVCNGLELSSGAIRNHIPELMYKLFSIAGYSKQDVDQKFSGMINALSLSLIHI